MGHATPKQIDFILKQGWKTLEEIDGMSFEEANAIISSKLEKKQDNRQPAKSFPTTPYKPASTYSKPQQSTETMYVSYAKDLTVAMIAKHETGLTSDITKQMLLDNVRNIKAAITEFSK